MKLDHISLSAAQNGTSEEYRYRICAGLREIPGKQWQEGLLFVWFNSPFYLCNKSELIIKENEIELFLKDGNDIQNAIDTLSHCILKADKMIRRTGITYISNYRKVMS